MADVYAAIIEGLRAALRPPPGTYAQVIDSFHSGDGHYGPQYHLYYGNRTGWGRGDARYATLTCEPDHILLSLDRPMPQSRFDYADPLLVEHIQEAIDADGS